MTPRIVVVGGGSAGWGPKLLADLMLTPAIADSTFVLHDIKPKNAQRIAAFARKLRDELHVNTTIEIEGDPDQALRGADYVLITISTGGLDAMAHDLSIPEAYGIYHTVGDTVGPGGWARTMRNAPVFVDLAQRINRLAPKAVILNYTNPMAQLTKALCLSTTRPVVGLCHGLFENLEFLKQVFELQSEDEIQCTYSGTNHFFWITSLSVKGRDGMELFYAKKGKLSLPEMRVKYTPDHPGSYLADELLRFTGVLPYLGDRHTSEFLSPYLTSQENLATYHLVRTTIEQRREGMHRTEKHIEEMTAADIPAHYKTRSRETAADIISALVTGRSFIDVGNVPNIGQAANLPKGSVLETPVVVTPSGFRPITQPALPEPVRSWIERIAVVQDLSVEAAMSGDLGKAMKALALDPLVSHLNAAQIEELGLKLLQANAAYLPQFRGAL